MKGDCILRETVLRYIAGSELAAGMFGDRKAERFCQTMYRFVRNIPPADVVARDCYDRILAENDTMRDQLAKVGKKVGDKMDDLRPVTKGHWLWDRGTRTCSNCGQMKATDKKDNFCSCCGADNREVKTK